MKKTEYKIHNMRHNLQPATENMEGKKTAAEASYCFALSW